MALGMKYLRRGRGGRRRCPWCCRRWTPAAIDAAADQLAGVCLSGGPDLDPAAYGAAPHPQLGPTEPELDRFELALARRADARGLPVLAICRGVQVLNVARGGTLHQHLPDVVDATVDHRQREPGDATPRTTSTIEPGRARRGCSGGRSRRSTPSTTRPSTGSGAGCARWPGRPTAWSRASRRRTATFVRRRAVARRGARRPAPSSAALFEAWWTAAPATPPDASCAQGGMTARQPVPGVGRVEGRPAAEAYTVGIEEEVMLLDPGDWSLAYAIDERAARARPTSSPRT